MAKLVDDYLGGAPALAPFFAHPPSTPLHSLAPAALADAALCDAINAMQKTLGGNGTIDSGLVRITDSGKWPFAEMGQSSAMKKDDWCIVTGQPGHAGAIASLETFTKIALYYLHERLWRLVRWAPNAHLRSLFKAVSWRLLGSLDTFMLSFLVTGRLRYAVSIAGGEALTKIALYYVHERAWRRVAWGRLDGERALRRPAARRARRAALIG